MSFALVLDGHVRCPVCARAVDTKMAGDYGDLTLLVRKHRRNPARPDTCPGSWSFPAGTTPTDEDQERRRRFLEAEAKARAARPAEPRGRLFDRLELEAAVRHLQLAVAGLKDFAPEAAAAAAQSLALARRARRRCDPGLL